MVILSKGHPLKKVQITIMQAFLKLNKNPQEWPPLNSGHKSSLKEVVIIDVSLYLVVFRKYLLFYLNDPSLPILYWAHISIPSLLSAIHGPSFYLDHWIPQLLPSSHVQHPSCWIIIDPCFVHYTKVLIMDLGELFNGKSCRKWEYFPALNQTSVLHSCCLVNKHVCLALHSIHFMITYIHKLIESFCKILLPNKSYKCRIVSSILTIKLNCVRWSNEMKYGES